MNAIEVLSDSSIDEEYNALEELDTLKQLSEKYKPILENNISDDKRPGNSKSTTLKEDKIKERERKKTEKENEKWLKKALTAAHKNVKPGECMKFITTHLDNEIMNNDYGTEIISALQAADIEYKVKSQAFSNTITWMRKNQNHFLDDEGQLVLSSEDQDADEILVVMNCKDLVVHVSNNTLSSHIQSLKGILINKKITLAIVGLQNYIKRRNNLKQNEFKDLVSNDDQKQSKGAKIYNDFPQISRKQIEDALTELQILCKCSHRLIQTSSEMGTMVVQFTKSVAELSFKLQKQEKYQQIDWFAAGDNRDCVKVDKDGNGLQRLYKQILITFPLASLETAEAIASQYPTVTSLMEAYEQCSSMAEAESLLKDIPIRRAAGPFSTTRKIGPELSKKVFSFFTSLEGDSFL